MRYIIPIFKITHRLFSTNYIQQHIKVVNKGYCNLTYFRACLLKMFISEKPKNIYRLLNFFSEKRRFSALRSTNRLHPYVCLYSLKTQKDSLSDKFASNVLSKSKILDLRSKSLISFYRPFVIV